MFNPTPQRAAPTGWTPNTVIQPTRSGVTGFETTDWDSVPRLDYRTEKFRQLAVPDPARVVEDASEFEPWKPKQVPSDSAARASVPVSESDSASAASSDGSPSDLNPATQAFGDAASDDASTHRPQDAQGDASLTDDLDPASHEGEHKASIEDADGEAASENTARDASADESLNDDRQASGEQETSNETPHADATSSAPEDSTPSLDADAVQEACEAARREGHEQGLEAGRTQAQTQAQAQTEAEVQAVREQAENDKTQALQALREELEAELEPLKRQLSKTIEQVESLIGQPDKLYEHVKRLSLHLAEQLVIGELNMSSAAIERLIQRCLDELDLHGNHVVTVELNPQDKARLQERAGELTHTLSLQAVHTLQPGSVRVVVNDTMVEDLVGNRLDALARSLLVQPEVWREQSPFFRQPLAQRDSEVQDAPARPVSSRESTLRESVVRDSPVREAAPMPAEPPEQEPLKQATVEQETASAETEPSELAASTETMHPVDEILDASLDAPLDAQEGVDHLDTPDVTPTEEQGDRPHD